MTDRTEQWKGDRAINTLLVIILVGVLLRAFGTYIPSEEPLRWLAVALAALFTLLLALSLWPAVNVFISPSLYLIIQSTVTVILLLLPPNLDFFAVFFGILTVQAIRLFPRATAFRWIALFCLLMAVALIYGLGWLDALPLIMLYTALYIALAYFVVLKNQAETAQKDSQFLLEELRKAHVTLQEHAVQIEELAVVEERNRLARDLHDSVTQSLYSVTLFTQAAREWAGGGDLDQTIRSLDRASDTAGQALKEMRLLVYELRPPALEDENLVQALERRLDIVERRSGVQTRLLLETEGEIDLPPNVEEALYHIGQEALNNALKHAKASSVQVTLIHMPVNQLTPS